MRDLGADALLDRVAERVGRPLVVKPARGGSSLGLRRVDDADALPAALLSALAYDDRVLCERWVEGREVTVTVLRGEALPPVEAIPLDDHGYDFEARYTPGATEFAVPAEVGPEPAQVAAAACLALGCGAFARVDLLVPGRARRPGSWRSTSSPGLTETSTAPLAAQAAGMTFEELVAALLEDAARRWLKRARAVRAMRTAVIFDVHGNLAALEAVLAEAEAAGAAGYAVGGDLALFGPEPAACVDRLRALSERRVRAGQHRSLPRRAARHGPRALDGRGARRRARWRGCAEPAHAPGARRRTTRSWCTRRRAATRRS